MNQTDEMVEVVINPGEPDERSERHPRREVCARVYGGHRWTPEAGREGLGLGMVCARCGEAGRLLPRVSR